MNIKKYIFIPDFILERLVEGKHVEGSMYRDAFTGCITFNAYNRKSRESGYEPPKDRLICALETGWLKESARRIKFFSSVKKELGRRWVDVLMHRDLKQAMDVMEVEEILDRV